MIAFRVRVTGIVQGVGFRPFIYRLASKLGLNGYVENLGGSEVEIWVEGGEARLKEFLRLLRDEAPPAAVIENVSVERVEPRGFQGFAIRKSGSQRTMVSMIPPDLGVCEHCLREVLDPTSRWYRYAFHSCAWCGPRFTVIRRAPYDRENTSMASFPLCSECRREYSDPANTRRFHIQGISCPRCGPQLYLLDSRGSPVRTADPLVEAAKLIDEGGIVAVRGLGGFHLASLASDGDVVEELRRRKKRGRKPFAVMALNIDVARRIAVVDAEAEELLKSPQRPILVLPRRGGLVAEEVAPGLNTIGVMLPYTPLHYLLLSETRDGFLVMTSGNMSGRPLAKSIDEALQTLRGVADYFLVHNREIVNRADDSVIRFTDGTPTFLRRSRGYAPTWVEVDKPLGKAVAYGAMLNVTGAVSVEKYIIPTQHIGDVENVETLEFLEEALRFLRENYGVDDCEAPRICDLHPTYLTSRLALEEAARCGEEPLRVQHHVAHIAAVMAEQGLDEAYGIAVDGVGYGVDGKIWGGEVLHVYPGGYERLGHLEELPLPGGDRATRYPARIVAGLLSEELGLDEGMREAKRRRLQERLPGGAAELGVALRQAGGAPRATSMGRFLDAVSASLGVCWERSYEGEPAIRLEEVGLGGSLAGERLIEREGGLVLTRDFLLRLEDYRSRFGLRDLAYTAQYLASRRLGEIALEAGARKVLVSGGAAVNTIIVKALRDLFGRENVVLPRRLPPGDGGISAGQVYAALRLEAHERQ